MRFLVFLSIVLAVNAARLQKQHPGISPDCNKELMRLKDPKVQKASAECEQKGQYPDKVVAHLKKGEESEATKLVQEMFTKCASFSEKCAAEVAPGLVMELRFSGVAVSEKCMGEVGKVQKDPAAQQFAAKCQAEQKVAENILMALNKDDIKSAMKVADESLQKCMKMSEGCSWQLAPVLVNDVVMQAMQAQVAQQGQQQAVPETVVLAAPKAGSSVSPQILKLAIEAHSKGKVASLLNMAVPKVTLPTGKKLRSPVLLQTSSSVWVSRLLLALARNQL